MGIGDEAIEIDFIVEADEGIGFWIIETDFEVG